MDEDDNVFSRWSRRKRQAVAPSPEPVVEPVAAPAPEPAEPEEDEEQILARLGLPCPETMKAGDDFRPFMAPEVPGFLRKRAMRVLWRSNPVLANLDGLNDYDDDFTSPELTQKVLATAYKVGRGILRDVAASTEDVQAGDDAEVAEPAPSQVAQASGNRQIAPELEDDPVDPPSDEGTPGFRPQRMRFET